MPRGKGTPNKPARIANYFPKNWNPRHEAIVLAVLSGKSQKEVADIYEITPVHVGNLMKSPQALELKSKMFELLREESEDITVRMARVSEQALKNIESMMENETARKNAPFQHASLSLKVLQSVTPKGVVNPTVREQTNNTQINNNTLILTNPDFLRDIKDGLALSMKVSEAQTSAMKRLTDGREATG